MLPAGSFTRMRPLPVCTHTCFSVRRTESSCRPITRFARRRQLRLQDLAATPFVLFPRTHNPGFYDRVLASFAAAAVTPRIAEEIWPRANGIGLVRAGVGATFMCPSEAKQLPAEVLFRPLAGSRP